MSDEPIANELTRENQAGLSSFRATIEQTKWRGTSARC